MQKIKTKIEGTRIYLKTLHEKDATQNYCDWLNDKTVTKYILTKKATIEELKNYIKNCNANPNILLLGIFVKSNNAHIGNIKLEQKAERLDIAILVGDKNYWGKGLATEAIKLLTKYAFRTLKFNEVTLGVLKDNKAAIKVYKKAGFKIDRIEKKSVKYEGDKKLHDQVWMSKQK